MNDKQTQQPILQPSPEPIPHGWHRVTEGTIKEEDYTYQDRSWDLMRPSGYYPALKYCTGTDIKLSGLISVIRRNEPASVAPTEPLYDWENEPAWVNWMAIDRDGTVKRCVVEMITYSSVWGPNNQNCRYGYWAYEIKPLKDCPHWRDTLRQRPTKQVTGDNFSGRTKEAGMSSPGKARLDIPPIAPGENAGVAAQAMIPAAENLSSINQMAGGEGGSLDAKERIAELEAEIANMKSVLSNPAAVYVNILRGTIALTRENAMAFVGVDYQSALRRIEELDAENAILRAKVDDQLDQLKAMRTVIENALLSLAASAEPFDAACSQLRKVAGTPFVNETA